MRLIYAIAVIALAGVAAAAVAMSDTLLPLIGAAEARPAAKAAPPQPQPAVSPQYHYLIRTTLGALQDANTTGNYSVLRDLSAPSFQAKHTAADLADIFSVARRKPIDLAAAALKDPVITATSRPDPTRLHLDGSIAGVGERITFQLQYEAVNGHWRLAGVGLSSAKEGR